MADNPPEVLSRYQSATLSISGCTSYVPFNERGSRFTCLKTGDVLTTSEPDRVLSGQKSARGLNSGVTFQNPVRLVGTGRIGPMFGFNGSTIEFWMKLRGRHGTPTRIIHRYNDYYVEWDYNARRMTVGVRFANVDRGAITTASFTVSVAQRQDMVNNWTHFAFRIRVVDNRLVLEVFRNGVNVASSNVTDMTPSTIRYGDRGDAVRYIQDRFNEMYPKDKMPANGVFGVELWSRVINMQRFFGLSVDGIVGPDTWGALRLAYAARVGKPLRFMGKSYVPTTLLIFNGSTAGGANAYSGVDPYISDFASYATVLNISTLKSRTKMGNEPNYVAKTGSQEMLGEFGFTMKYTGLMTYQSIGSSGFGFDATVDESKTSIVRAKPWWDENYIYRCSTVYSAPPSGIPKGHPMYVHLAGDIRASGKVRHDLRDIAVIYLTEGDTGFVWRQLESSVTELDDGRIEVTFPLEEELPGGGSSIDDYYIYYGDRADLSVADMRVESVNEWHEVVSHDSGLVDLTRPDSDWETTEDMTVSKTTNAKATLSVYGDRLRVYCMKGPNMGVVSISMDGGTPEEVDLFSLTEEEVMAFEAHDLPSGLNSVRIMATGMKTPMSSSSSINFIRIEYGKHSTLNLDKEEISPIVSWGSTLGSVDVRRQ